MYKGLEVDEIELKDLMGVYKLKQFSLNDAFLKLNRFLTR
jgi:hypothetical protein